MTPSHPEVYRTLFSRGVSPLCPGASSSSADATFERLDGSAHIVSHRLSEAISESSAPRQINGNGNGASTCPGSGGCVALLRANGREIHTVSEGLPMTAGRYLLELRYENGRVHRCRSKDLAERMKYTNDITVVLKRSL